MPGKPQRVDFQEVCRQAPWTEAGAGQEGPRSFSLLGGQWPENTQIQRGMKRTWFSASVCIEKLALTLKKSALGLSLPGVGGLAS